MNKSKYIEELGKRTGYDKEKCSAINDVFEDTFIIGRKNKEKIIRKLIEQLNFSETEANDLYKISMDILSDAIKYKLKHPFSRK